MMALSLVVDRKTGARRAFAAAVIAKPERWANARVDVVDLVDYHAVEAMNAFCNVWAATKRMPTEQAIRDHLQAEHDMRGPHRAGETLRDLAWFDELVARPPVDDAEFERLESEIIADNEIQRAAERDGDGVPADDVPHPVNGPVPPELYLVPDGSPEDSPTPPRRWRRCADLVNDIVAHAGDRWTPLTLGGEQLVTVAPGAIVVLVAAAKRGKTSQAGCLLVEHALERGPAIACSLELPGREFVARIVGSRCDAGWGDVLRGGVPADHMRAALPERLLIVERDDATIDALAATIHDAQRLYPGQPVLVGLDYLQLVASTERDMRARVDDAMRQIDGLARRTGAVVLALSQSSRAASRLLASGERTGADAADSGAESAAIERWASAVIAIGTLGEPAQDGSQAAELSIAAQRMGAGDQVRTARVDLRTGRWRLDGDARPAAEARAEREAQRDTAVLAAALAAMVAAAEASAEPLTREQLGEHAVATMGRCPRQVQRHAIARALASGALAEVQRRPHKARAWLIWTPDRAAAAGIPLARGAS